MLPEGFTRDMLIENVVRSLNALKESESSFEITWTMKVTEVYFDQLRQFVYAEALQLESSENKW